MMCGGVGNSQSPIRSILTDIFLLLTLISPRGLLRDKNALEYYGKDRFGLLLGEFLSVNRVFKEEMELEQGAVSMVKGCFLYNAGALEESQKKKKKQIKSSMSSECSRLSSIESTLSSLYGNCIVSGYYSTCQ